MNQKLRRNIKRSRMFDPTVKKSANLAKRIKVRITNKAKIQAAITEALIKKAIPAPAAPAKEVKAPAKEAKEPKEGKGKK